MATSFIFSRKTKYYGVNALASCAGIKLEKRNGEGGTVIRVWALYKQGASDPREASCFIEIPSEMLGLIGQHLIEESATQKRLIDQKVVLEYQKVDGSRRWNGRRWRWVKKETTNPS